MIISNKKKIAIIEQTGQIKNKGHLGASDMSSKGRRERGGRTIEASGKAARLKRTEGSNVEDESKGRRRGSKDSKERR